MCSEHNEYLVDSTAISKKDHYGLYLLYHFKNTLHAVNQKDRPGLLLIEMTFS